MSNNINTMPYSGLLAQTAAHSPSLESETITEKVKYKAPNPIILTMKFKKELSNNTKKYLVIKGMKKFSYIQDHKIQFENFSLPILQNKEQPKPEDFKNWLTTKLIVPARQDLELFQVNAKIGDIKRVAVEIPESVQWEISVPNYLNPKIKLDLKNHVICHAARVFNFLKEKETISTGKKKIYNVDFYINPTKPNISQVSENPNDYKWDAEDYKLDLKFNTKYMTLLTNKNYYFTDDEPDTNNLVTIRLEGGLVDKFFGTKDEKTKE